MKMKKTSQYRKRVTIQELTETKNSRGMPIREWNNYKTVWANINTNIEDEQDIANSIKPMNRLEITIRYQSIIESKLKNTENTRIFYKVPYNILGVENVNEENIELKIKCEAIN